MKKERILKGVIYITGAICLFIFISIRFLPVYNVMLDEKLSNGYWDNTKYGECYYFNFISYFKEQGLPSAITKFQFSKAQTALDESDILIFGDSFFDISRGTQFPTLLSEKTGIKKMHYVYQELPLQYLALHDYKKGKRKILILGLVERYIPFKFAAPHHAEKHPENQSTFKKSVRNGIDYVFYERSEELYDALLKRSYLTTFTYSKIADLKFDLFGYISRLTPRYLADPENPWLFYFDQVNDENSSFYYQHTDEEIQKICANIKDLQIQLRDLYNINLIFLPIPAQYTICHQVINDDAYNQFIPRLQKGLSTQGVPFVEIYDEFKSSNEILYYGTDGHWNVKGLTIAVEKTADFLNEFK